MRSRLHPTLRPGEASGGGRKQQNRRDEQRDVCTEASKDTSADGIPCIRTARLDVLLYRPGRILIQEQNINILEQNIFVLELQNILIQEQNIHILDF